MKIIVVGAGLAGAACAYALARRGAAVTVLSQGGGASELPAGLLAAHLSAQDVELSQLSRIGVELTLFYAQALLKEGRDWQPSFLEQRLLFHPEKNERLLQAAAKLPDWYETRGDTVIHKKAAWIKPQALASAWLAQPGITLCATRAAALRRVDGLWHAFDAQGTSIAQAQIIVIAAGAQSSELLAQCGHPLLMDNVSGSIAIGAWPDEWASQNSQPMVNGNGSFLSGIAQANGDKFWTSGATYEREIHASPQALQAASLRANQARLAELLPPELLAHTNAQFAAGQVQSWQGIRCTTSDRLPIVGELESGLYACTGMGSRGLSFAAMCGQILAQEIMQHVVQDSAHHDRAPIISAQHRKLLLPQRKTLKVAS